MTDTRELDELIESERRARPDPERAERGWERLSGALAGGAMPPPGLDAAGPLQLSATGAVTGAVGKWVAVCAVGGTLAAGAVGGSWALLGGGSSEDAAPAAAAVSAALSSSQPSPAASQARSDLPGSDAAEDLALPNPDRRTQDQEEQGRRARGAAREQADPPGAAASVSTFDAELVLIKRAKANLDSGRGAAALAQLNEHARRYPRGVFAGEREALRILALCSSGRSSQGRSLAARFVREHARSPLVDRVRRACGLPEADSVP